MSPANRNLSERNSHGSCGLLASSVFPKPPMRTAVISAVKALLFGLVSTVHISAAVTI